MNRFHLGGSQCAHTNSITAVKDESKSSSAENKISTGLN